MKMTASLITAALLNLGVFVGASIGFSTSSFAQKNDVVASVGEKKITLEDFNKKYNEIRMSTINPPTRAVFLEDMVRYELGVQEAEKRKLDQDPMVKDRFRQEMYKVLLEKELGQKIQKMEVSDAEMKEFYKTSPEVRTSHILVSYKPGANAEQIAEAKKRATEILDEVKKSKRPFEELVRLYSDDPLSKQAGGDVGWQSRVALVPAYYDAALAMKPGEVKGLIETQFGFHIVKLVGRRTYEEADKKQIRAAVFDQKRRATFNEFFDKLKKGYSIKTNPELLK